MNGFLTKQEKQLSKEFPVIVVVYFCEGHQFIIIIIIQLTQKHSLQLCVISVYVYMCVQVYMCVCMYTCVA